MQKRTAHRARWLGAGVFLIALAVPAVSGAALGASPGGDAPAFAPAASGSSTTDAGSPAADPGTTRPIEGTQLAVPVPDPEIGTEVRDLTIPLQEGEAVVHGVAFYRAGPMEGSVVGGVSVVYDDSSAVRTADGGVADLDTIRNWVNPDLEPEVSTIGNRTVLGWPDSEVVPSEWIPQEDRSISRYVVVLDSGIAMVTFDDVAPQQAQAYLQAVAGAL